ncbi:lipoprotein-releasing system permease protein [Dysgonomonas sp. PFB1-18]|uniref:FtsX-like permease family protein n=1 Tax=unclassified Dysgonomonas TaxID=2630389 RepID=UPI0024769C94|nr:MULTISPECIES: FtsX-like permease family protein [unclassified Dysgonomonas]MDH6310770.1 lipoprotein-releasing system permease protein [Dysgonomonas sp. PF1-14]MDH6340620.1 lipoprotein-releasing system permease protein [Dysgonomonas sp. PF1-16]MDH6382273.1 lipoprotein-releasing system permease protein [Dysgonomonas sp. PFB1-18]MDH6399590.1 lipoprotein-releasing system permease protein [Dysgonomonas sp. PF1-23]
MNLPLHIARRYLFAKKSHNAINVISFISVCGITVATLALVCALSVFNGFTGVVANTFSDFDPELQITPASGKVFNPSSPAIEQIKSLPEIEFTSESLEENALVTYGERQEPIVLKGVSPRFKDLANIDKVIIDGKFMLREGDVDNGVIGAGLAMFIGVRANFVDPVEIYVPKRNVRVNPSNLSTDFDRASVFISGVFALNQVKYDDQMLIIPIEMARELLRYETEVSSIDIKVKNGANVEDVHKKISAILGDDLLVKNRFQQQEDLYRMVNIEKWVTFLILGIILIIAVFNIVGSLSILIIEKNEDIGILKSLGANKTLISRIFLFEGWLITLIGAVAGIILGVCLCLLQQHFGLIGLGSSAGQFVVDAYPVEVQLPDIILIFVTVNVIGFLAVLYPVNNLRKRL